jgi:O-antigen/teichoic acid export membrane protein
MIGRKSLLALLSVFFVRLLKSVVFIIAVNTFSPVKFGFYQVAASTMAIYILISDFGISSVHIKKMAELEDKNMAFTIFFVIKIILIIISSLFTYAFIFLQTLNGIISTSSEQMWIFIILYIQITFDIALSSIYEISFRGKMNVAKMVLPNIISNLLGATFSLITVLIFQNFLLYLSGALIASLIKFFILNYVGREFKLKKINLDLFRTYIKISVWFLVPTILNTLIKSLGPFFFLNYFDEKLLGIYTVISTIFGMVTIIHDSLRLLLIPNYTTFLVNGKIQDLESFIELYKKYMIILNGILIIGGIIFSEFLITNLLGEIYYEKGLILYYFFLFALMEFPLFFSYTPLVLAGEKFKIYTKIKFFEFLFSIICWIFLIPKLGIIAIVFARLIFIIPNSIIFRNFCQKEFGIGKPSRQEKINLLILVIFIFCGYLVSLFHFNLLISIFFFLIIIGLYFGFLSINKIMKKEDIIYILDLLNPSKMKDYIKSEFNNRVEGSID